MSQPPSFHYSYSPGIQSLIPLLYVAWADRVLTPTEINVLKKKASLSDFLSEEDKEVLLQWANPKRPPSPQLFKYWEIELRQAAARFPEGSLPSLASLGAAMAEQASKQNQTATVKNWASPEIQAQLKALEENLGSINIETYHWIFRSESVV